MTMPPSVICRGQMTASPKGDALDGCGDITAQVDAGKVCVAVPPLSHLR